MSNKILSKVNTNSKCRVLSFEGGPNMQTKLENLGIRIGNEITVVNSSFIGGPITVLAGNTKVAIGRKMAERIIVEVRK